MIAKQKESRRDRHIKTLNDFEKWTESLSLDAAESYIDIKNDIEKFFEDQDKELVQYFDKFTDAVLLKREKDLLDELNKVVIVNQSSEITVYLCILSILYQIRIVVIARNKK